MQVDLILFDWGGTLSDVSGQPGALCEGAREVGRLLAGTTDGQVASELASEALAAERRAAADPQCREVDLAGLLCAWAQRRGLAADAARIAEAVGAIGRSWVGRALRPIPGAPEALGVLRARGVRLGLVSNVWIPAAFCREELRREGFGSLLDLAVFSSELGFRKPAPAVYEAALAAAFGADRPADLSGVLFVGDSPVCDVIAPARLGMRTALVASPPGVWPEAELAAARPDLRLASVAELPVLLGLGNGPGCGVSPRGRRPVE